MNVKKLFKKPIRYTDYEGASPAARAARKMDEREGEIIVQNEMLRKIALGQMLVVILLAGALIYKCLQSSVMPYVVEVDNATG